MFWKLARVTSPPAVFTSVLSVSTPVLLSIFGSSASSVTFAGLAASRRL